MPDCGVHSPFVCPKGGFQFVQYYGHRGQNHQGYKQAIPWLNIGLLFRTKMKKCGEKRALLHSDSHNPFPRLLKDGGRKLIEFTLRSSQVALPVGVCSYRTPPSSSWQWPGEERCGIWEFGEFGKVFFHVWCQTCVCSLIYSAILLFLLIVRQNISKGVLAY